MLFAGLKELRGRYHYFSLQNTFFLLKYSSLDKYVKSTSGRALSLLIFSWRLEVLQLGAITESAFVSGLTRMCPSAGVMQVNYFSTCLHRKRALLSTTLFFLEMAKRNPERLLILNCHKNMDCGFI